MPRSARPQLRRSALVAGSVVATASLLLAGCGSKASDTDASQRRVVRRHLGLDHQGRLPELTVGHDGDQRGDRPRRHHARGRRDQRRRRRPGQADRDRRRGRRVRADRVRREGREADQQRLRRRGVRRLDLVEPQGDAAGVRGATTRCCSTRCSTRAWSRRRTSSTPVRPPTSRSSRRWTTSRRRASRRSSWSAATTSSRGPRTGSSRRTPAANGIEIEGEEYAPLGSTDFSTIVNKIRTADADVVFNTLNGDSNVAFFKEYTNVGLTAADDADDLGVDRRGRGRRHRRRRTSPAS